jgi:hypothetical protein
MADSAVEGSTAGRFMAASGRDSWVPDSIAGLCTLASSIAVHFSPRATPSYTGHFSSVRFQRSMRHRIQRAS